MKMGKRSGSMDPKRKLVRAMYLHEDGRIMEAQQLYGEAVVDLEQILSKKDWDPLKKKSFRVRINFFAARKNRLTRKIREMENPSAPIEDLIICEDDTGYSHQTIFGKYLTPSLREVIIRESELRKKNQFRSLVIFLELLVKNCQHLKYVRVVTVPSVESENQAEIFRKIGADLDKRGITFNYQYEYFHERKILLDNGYLFKLGRGLSYFKSCDEYSLGICDYDYRKCDATGITIFRTKSF